MSRQIQIRRGTAAEHENFTGATGEVTMDTTNKTLRVHDGETPGGIALAKQSEIPDLSNIDYVVDFQVPAAENNYTWYRKYKSGWIEQGGVFTTNSQDYSVTLPIQMSDANYVILALADNNSGIAGSFTMIDGGSQTNTGFVIVVNFYGNQPSQKHGRWFVSGISA